MEEAIKETLQNKHYFLSWVFFFLAAEPAAAVQTGWWMQTIWNNSFSLGSINTTFSLLMCVCVCHNTHTRGGGDFYFTALETDSYYRFNDFTFQSVPLDFSAVNVVKKKLSERGDRWPQWHKKNILQKLVYMIPALTVEQNQNCEGAASSGWAELNPSYIWAVDSRLLSGEQMWDMSGWEVNLRRAAKVLGRCGHFPGKFPFFCSFFPHCEEFKETSD